MATAKRGRAGNALLLAVFGTCLVAAAYLIGEQVSADMAYRNLGSEVSDACATGGADGGIDWDGLLAQNPDTVAWLTVEGTRVDYPVVQPAAGKASDWYLGHDFWGNPSSVGCLYLDRRASANGRHMLVFGHHLGFSGQMFSDIFDSYEQGEFDGIGTARWSTPEGGTAEFEPIMAMSVDKTYAPIQSFEFATVDDLQSWLGELSRDATAASPDLEALADGASRALTLVTCSSAWSGQRARTLLVFVA